MQNSIRVVSVETTNGPIEIDFDDPMCILSTLAKTDDEGNFEYTYVKDGKSRKVTMTFEQNFDLYNKYCKYHDVKNGNKPKDSYIQIKVKN